jgi:hypothetical protein
LSRIGDMSFRAMILSDVSSGEPYNLDTPTMSNRFLRTSLLLGATLSLVVCFRVVTQSILLGSREGRWVYPYIHSFDVRPLAIFLVVSAAAGSLVAIQGALTRRSEWLPVLVWVVAALGLQGLLRSLTPYTFETIFTSDGANAFYGVARHYTAPTVLSDFDRLRAYWPVHAQSNMPGKLMLVYALKNISRRPDVLAWLVVLVSNLGGVLMYVFVRDLFADRRVALYSLVLYLFVPAKLFFFPLLNTVTPVVVLCCACLVLRWFMTGSAIYAAMFGIALYGLVFYEPLPLVMGLLFAALAARALWRADTTWRQLLLQSGVVIVAFATAYALIRIWSGFDLISAFRQIGAHAVAFNAEAARPYSIWVRENLVEFLFGVGLCQAVVFWAALGEGLAGADSWRSRMTQPITVLCLGLAGVLLATDLIGINRGEVIRLWIFLACFFQIPTAYVCAKLDNSAAMVVVLVTTLLQNALGTAMIGFIVP